MTIVTLTPVVQEWPKQLVNHLIGRKYDLTHNLPGHEVASGEATYVWTQDNPRVHPIPDTRKVSEYLIVTRLRDGQFVVSDSWSGRS